MPHSRSSKKSLLILSLHGACWDGLASWLAQGQMPVLCSLKQSGRFGPLKAVLPTLPLPNWASFWTGESPDRHGIFGFAALGETDVIRHPVDRRHLNRPTWLDIASGEGLRIVSVYAPLTYPPNRANGFLVSPRAAKGCANLPELEREIRAQFKPLLVPQYQQFLPPQGFRAFDDVRAFVQGQIESVRQTKDLTKYLMEKSAWDVTIVDFFATDPIQHALWHGIDSGHPAFEPKLHEEVGLFFSALDSAMGELIEAANPSAVLVFSDHGFTTCRRILNLARCLFDHGLLRPRPLLERAWRRALRETRLLYVPVRQPWIVAPDRRQSIYFDTKAVYVFHPQGDSHALVQEVADILSSVEDPTTRIQPIRRVHRPEVPRHADDVRKNSVLVLDFIEGDTARGGSLTGPLFSTPKANDDYLIGTHTKTGLWAFSGEGISHAENQLVSILDLPPTILRYLGLAVPQWMEMTGLLL